MRFSGREHPDRNRKKYPRIVRGITYVEIGSRIAGLLGTVRSPVSQSNDNDYGGNRLYALKIRDGKPKTTQLMRDQKQSHPRL